MKVQVNEIVEELYKCLPNDRHKFNLVMENLKAKFLSINNNQDTLNSIYNYQELNPEVKNKNTFFNFKSTSINKEKKNNNHNNYRNASCDNKKDNYNIYQNFKNQNDFNNHNLVNCRGFINDKKNQEKLYLNRTDVTEKNKTSRFFPCTLPEVLLLSKKPLTIFSQQNKYSDTHANCKFYYPETYNPLYETNNDLDNMEWHNKANNIMLNTNNSFYPKSEERNFI